MAAVVDTEINDNIIPFRCNCGLPDDRHDELERIEANWEECEEEGVCKFLMELGDLWENVPREVNGFHITRKITRQKVTETGEIIMYPINVPCITMTSVLFCKHGGLIVPVKSGQKMTVKVTWRNITQIGDWDAKRIYLARYLTEILMEQGYPNEIIAGMVGNVVNEGDFGKFESSFYETNPDDKPKYLIHMEDECEYDIFASNKYLYEIGMKVFDNLARKNGCTDALHTYGLGLAQWTYDRCDRLVKKYKDRFKSEETPTLFQCQQVEIEFMLEELAGDYHGVIVNCEAKLSLGGEAAVKEITHIIFKDYENPKDQSSKKLEKRRKDALLWYKVLTEPVYEVIGDD